MTRVFISYRTDDDNFAAVILEGRLSARFGQDNVFRDSRQVPPGVDFEPVLWRSLASSTLVVAVIGPRWLTGAGTERRLTRTTDFVRRELEFAFDLDLPVLPLLVGDASMPNVADLPDSLRRLVNCQYRRMHPRNAEADLQRLVDEIHEVYGERRAARPGTVAVIRPAAGPVPDRLVALVRRSTVDAGLPTAMIETVAEGVQLVQPDAERAVAVAGDFVRALDDALRAEDGIGPVRLAVHYGEVVPAPDEALRMAHRLSGDTVLDDVLQATSGARIALVASDAFYQLAVRPGYRAVDRSTYARARLSDTDVWVQVPGFPAPRGLPTPAPTPPAAAPPAVPAQYQVNTVHGDFVAHDKHVYGGRG